MKKVFSILLIGLTTFGLAQDYWTKRDSVNGPARGAGVSFVLNGEGYFGTGVNIAEFKRKVYSYDLSSDDWDNETSLGGTSGTGLNRASAIGFDAEGFGYIGLGSGATPYMNDLWKYDPETGTWTQMANFQGEARRGAVSFSIDGIAYVGTGESETGLKDDFYKYVPSDNEWIQVSEFPNGARKEAVGFTMGGKGYVGTGKGATIFHDDFWQYDPIEDEWKQLADFPGTPRMGAVGCGVFPSAFIMLGEDNNADFRKDVWEYNYFADIWAQRADYPGGTRTQASAMVVQNRIFVGLGYNGVYHDDFYEYTQFIGLEEAHDPALTIQIFPNPIIDKFTIHIPNSVTFTNLKVLSLNGKKVYETKNTKNYNTNNYTYSPKPKLETGVYVLRLENNGEIVVSKKIVVL